MAYYNYTPDNRVEVWPHDVRGGLDTIVSIVQLFDASVDCQHFGAPLIICNNAELPKEEWDVLRELLREYAI